MNQSAILSLRVLPNPTEILTTIAYATIPGSVLRRRVDSLSIEAPDIESQLIPFHELERLVVVGRSQLTSDATRSLLDHRIPTTFITRGGRLVGSLQPPSMSVGAVRRGQLVISLSPERRLAAARRVVRSKIQAMRRRLISWRRNHDSILEVDAVIENLIQAEESAGTPTEGRRLFGHEGAASRQYWTGVSTALQQKFGFRNRRSRPAMDPINAMLSFGYALLRTEVQSAVDAEGLDPWTGVHHVSHGRRPSLVLDLMEPWRHRMIDKLVMTLVNRNQFSEDDFLNASTAREDDDHGIDGVRFKPKPLRRFIEAYEAAAERPADDGDRPFRLELHQRVREIAFAMARHGHLPSPFAETTHDPTSLADDTIEPPSSS